MRIEIVHIPDAPMVESIEKNGTTYINLDYTPDKEGTK